ncbi:urease accessory protein UreD [Azospirillum brasilense]|uniref:urease accessory protein UreD n=1 Tax=Azospirillum brasilense TaxID=192 RepID=UPI001FFF29CE|nr:urease accessory protein UreD [Azospirillum brasilense]
MDGDLAETLAHPAGFGGAGACATLLFAAPDAGSRLDALRAAAEGLEGVRVGATAFDGLLVVRILGGEARSVRNAYAALWSHLRAAAAGLPTRLPRLWEV